MKTYPPTPPTRLETWLGTFDGYQLAAAIIALAVLAFVCGMAVSIVRIVAGGRVQQSRTVAVSSSRKSGRRSA